MQALKISQQSRCRDAARRWSSASTWSDKQTTWSDGEVFGASLEDMVEMVKTIANRAGRVAKCKVPPVLFSE